MRTSAHTSGALKELYEIAWIAKVICAETHIGDDNPAIQKMSILFRDFWLCAVVFVLQPNGKWPNGWKTIMHQIASKSPPMTDAQQERLLEADLQAHSILGKTFMEESQQRVRRMFSEAFATKAPVAKTYSFPKCAYLLMVQHLEILRARRASIKTILVYLIDDRLYNDDAYDLLYVIGNEVVSTFLSRSQSMTVAARLDVEERTMDLLYTAASRLGRARTFSVNTIRKMLSKLPWLLWSRTVVYRMLDIMQCLDPRFQHDMARRGLLQEKVGIELTFLNDSDVIDAASDFFDFCREWIETATAKSTNETMGMLQVRATSLLK
ncbi:hypothetical protein DFS34DRAFT_392300 [Phlyctochytrium arcticum]|nr:hypothetical protein DFS34DRAFT_392300 [Phlyctochytrium arcticum]